MAPYVFVCARARAAMSKYRGSTVSLKVTARRKTDPVTAALDSVSYVRACNAVGSTRGASRVGWDGGRGVRWGSRAGGIDSRSRQGWIPRRRGAGGRRGPPECTCGGPSAAAC